MRSATHSVSLEVLGVLAQHQGVELELSGHAAGALALLVDGRAADQLKHGGDEKEPAEGVWHREETMQGDE